MGMTTRGYTPQLGDKVKHTWITNNVMQTNTLNWSSGNAVMKGHLYELIKAAPLTEAQLDAKLKVDFPIGARVERTHLRVPHAQRDGVVIGYGKKDGQRCVLVYLSFAFGTAAVGPQYLDLVR